MKKQIWTIITILVFVTLLVVIIINQFTYTESPLIRNFDDCVRVGGVVLEGYPRQCSINETVFVEEIDNEISDNDLLMYCIGDVVSVSDCGLYIKIVSPSGEDYVRKDGREEECPFSPPNLNGEDDCPEINPECGATIRCSNYPKNRIYCQESQRNVDACITLYKPVCGYYDQEKIQGRGVNPFQKYSNSCAACSSEFVLYYVEGECPE